MRVQSLDQKTLPGAGNGNPPQYSCLGNPTDRGAWRAAVQGVAESGATEQLSPAEHQGGKDETNTLECKY